MTEGIASSDRIRSRSRRSRGSSSVLVVIALIAGHPGCGTSLTESLRSHAYPPDFRYVPDDKLRVSMWLLGHETAELRRVLADPSISDDTRRTRAELLLGGMEDTVQKIGVGEWSSNHENLQSGLEALQSDIHAAHEAVNHDPPNYFLAGSVSGACLYCHSR
jgi:hypothetical protein